MPLKKGYGRKIIGKNIAEMEKSGHDPEQAVAASLNEAREAAKDAGGKHLSKYLQQKKLRSGK